MAVESRAWGRRIRSILGWLLSLGFIGGLAWNAPVREIMGTLGQAQWEPLGWAMALVLLHLSLRGLRWRQLFRPHHDPPLGASTEIAIVGLGLNAVLPGRVGEVARIGLAARRFRSSLSYTAATIVTERVIDGILLVSLILVGLAGLGFPALSGADGAGAPALTGETMRGLAMGVLSGCLALLAGLLILGSRQARRTLWRLHRSLSSRRLRSWLVGLRRVLDQVRYSLGSVKRPRSFVGILGSSLCLWLLVTAANLVVAEAFEGLKLGFFQVLVMTGLSIAASSAPSAPGAWGVFEAAALLGLGIAGVDVDPAVATAYVVTAHLCQYLPVVAATGVLILWRNLRQVRVVTSESRGSEKGTRRPETESDVAESISPPGAANSSRED